MLKSRVPTLYCPFESTLSPYAAIIDQHTLDWARAFGLITSDSLARHMQDTYFGWLAAYLAPAASLETLQLLSDWNTWAILWDDICDRPDLRSQPARLKQYHAGFLALLRSGPASDNASPLAAALWNIRQRLCRDATTLQLRRFIAHVAEFFAGCTWEATNRAQQRPIDLATYIPMRRFTSGMYTSLKVIEIAEQITIPITVWRDPAIARLRAQATNAVCWANDIISLDQELQRGDMHNLIVILQRTEHRSLASSIARGVDMHDAEVDAFLSGEAALRSFGASIDQQLARYTALLRSFMYGNLAWSALSGRYGEGEGQAIALGESHASPPARLHEVFMRTTRR